MREAGRGEEGTPGVTVAAAVAILERQPEEQRRNSARPRLGEKVAFLQSRLCGASSPPSKAAKSKYSDKFSKSDCEETKKQEGAVNHVIKNEGACFSEIKKSSSTKNISALIQGNSTVPDLKNVNFSSGEPKKSDLQKKSPSSVNFKTEKPPPEFSPKQNQLKPPPSKAACELQRSSSTKEALDRKICDYDDDGLEEPSGRLHSDSELHNSVSDSNIPRKRPRVIHLRDSAKDGRVEPKSPPEALGNSNETHNSSVRIVLEYPPPPTTSPPPEYDERPGSALTGASSPLSAQRMVSTDSLGSYELIY